jgi:hypothetical protein
LKEDKYTIDGARQVLDRTEREELLAPTAKEELLELRGFLEHLLEEI